MRIEHTYCYYHNVRMHYYPYAVYYDEQPEDAKTLHKQHVRWVWGFLANRKKFKKGGVVYKENSKIRRLFSIIEYNVSIYPFLIMTIVLLISAKIFVNISSVLFPPFYYKLSLPPIKKIII